MPTASPDTLPTASMYFPTSSPHTSAALSTAMTQNTPVAMLLSGRIIFISPVKRSCMEDARFR
jgi:hypothetical protein